MTEDADDDRIGPGIVPSLVAGRSEHMGRAGAGERGAGAAGLVMLGLAARLEEVPGSVAGGPSRDRSVREHGSRGEVGRSRGILRFRGSFAYPPDPGRTPD